MSKIKLSPCPFCGRTPKTSHNAVKVPSAYNIYNCREAHVDHTSKIESCCDVVGERVESFQSSKEKKFELESLCNRMINEWNTRWDQSE